MKKAEIFLFASFSFIVGIAVGLIASANFLTIYIFILISAVCLVFFFNNANLRILFIGILFLFVGAARANFPNKEKSKTIGKYNGKEMRVIGIIKDGVERSYKFQKLKIQVEKINDGEKWIASRGDLLAYLKLYPAYSYNDVLEASCELKEPEPFDNFRYDKYLEMDGIYSICYYPEVKLLGKRNDNFIMAKIFKFKDFLQSVIDFNINQPQAGILSAMILGNKYGLEKKSRQLFSDAGISHIIAISGMHIACFACIVLVLLICIHISRKKAFYICSFIIGAYVIAIGSPSSAVRAAIMAFAALLAIQLGRLSKLINAIFLAAAIMLLINPAILFYDLGFQFSFLALLGIFCLFPIIKQILKIPVNEYIKGLINMSLCAIIFTFPLALYYFNFLPLTAIFANILIIWTLPMIMFLGMLLFFFSLINLIVPFFAVFIKIISLLISVILKYVISSAKMTASFKTFSINVELFSLWKVFVCYFVIAAVILILRKRCKL